MPPLTTLTWSLCVNHASQATQKEPQTVLMKNSSLKMPEKSFKENNIFFMKKIVGSALELSAKVFFSFNRYQLRTLFLLFNI